MRGIEKKLQYSFKHQPSGLATMLERANCSNFKVNFQKKKLFFLWVNLCFKVKLGEDSFGIGG